jgi:hypothetical protein
VGDCSRLGGACVRGAGKSTSVYTPGDLSGRRLLNVDDHPHLKRGLSGARSPRGDAKLLLGSDDSCARGELDDLRTPVDVLVVAGPVAEPSSVARSSSAHCARDVFLPKPEHLEVAQLFGESAERCGCDLAL